MENGEIISKPKELWIFSKVCTPAISDSSKTVGIFLSQCLRYCIRILKFFGYFPFSFDPNNGFLRFRFLSAEFFYSISILIIYSTGFLHLFILGPAFDEIFKKAKIAMNGVDFIIFFSEAYISYFVFIVLLIEPLFTSNNLIKFWNKLQDMFRELGDPRCAIKLKRETFKLLLLYVFGMTCFVIIMSANSNADLEQVSLSDMAFMGVWSIFGISYVFIFVYCTLILSAIIILFEQVEKMMKANFLLWTSYRGGGGSNKPISVTDSSTDPEVQLYYAQEKFEETVQLFNEFQNSFGFKLLICVTKVCFSTFLTFRLLILVMKVKVGGESSSLFQVTVLHTSHLWGLLFLLSLCNNAKNMASKVMVLPDFLINDVRFIMTHYRYL